MLLWTYQLMFLGSPLLLAALVHGFCIRYEWFPVLKKPLDFGLSFRGKRVFGDNKTWRGLLVQVIFCILGATIQGWLQKQGVVPPGLVFFDYAEYGPAVGFFLGLGMTIGELPNSFLKRQLDIPPGRRRGGGWGLLFFFLDQVDLALGIWLFFFLVVRPPALLVLWSLVLTAALHLAVSSVGYILRMRETVS
jgi:hypothetical protein